MAENSKIAWTDHTFNPWIGCTRVSPGCENCYAENLMDKRYGRVEWGPGKPRSRTKTWGDPVKWNKAAKASGVRKKVFCASLADWLDDEVPLPWREDLFALIDDCPHLDWLMLTKRPQNAKAMLPPSWWDNPRPWVWFGVTAENQKYWDIRVPMLLAIPAALRWVSYEPALGPIDEMFPHRQVGACDRFRTTVEGDTFCSKCNRGQKYHDPLLTDTRIDWVIIGGESEQNSPARSFEIEWCESAIEQCRKAGCVPFMKQTGTNATYRGEPFKTKDKAGTNPDEWPEFIRVREFPQCAP